MAILEDGSGNSYKAAVSSENRLKVDAEVSSLQHIHALEFENAYQTWSIVTSSNGETSALHIKNTSQTDRLVITYIRLQPLGLSGGTTIPNTGSYWEFGVGRTRDSEGLVSTVTNTNAAGSSSPLAEIYEGCQTTGTFNSLERVFPNENGQMFTFNKEGSIVIPTNKTFEVRWISDHDTGSIYTRVSFFYKSNEH